LGWVEFGIEVEIEVEVSVFGDSVVLQYFGIEFVEMLCRGMIFGLLFVVTPSIMSYTPNRNQILGLWYGFGLMEGLKVLD